jgi:hypothetical protein
LTRETTIDTHKIETLPCTTIPDQTSTIGQMGICKTKKIAIVDNTIYEINISCST